MAIVCRVTGDCPGCGRKDGFGKVDVYETYVYLGCKSCRYRSRIPLPKLRKKILYLDQFFFSRALRGQSPKYQKVAQLIEKASAEQLLVAPYSTVHEDETHLWEKRDELFKFIKATCRGHTFVMESDVDQTQIWKAFKGWLDKAPAEYQIEERDVLRDNVHKWDGYMRFEVGRYTGDIELIRSLKAQSVEGLVDLFPSWRSSSATFEQDLEQEHLASFRGYFDAYVDYMKRMVSGDIDAFMSAPVISMVVESMLRIVPSEIPAEGRLKLCAEFMANSAHFRNIPSQNLSARIYATVKNMVRQGSYLNRDSALKVFHGFFYDVKHISTYAPYCDAFLMDNRMADIVSKPSVGLEQRYGTKVFCENSWEELIAWLEGLSGTMTEEHRAGLIAAYQ